MIRSIQELLMKMKSMITLVAILIVSNLSLAVELKLNDKAPLFSAENQAGQNFQLNSRKGHWTVLYFYPKAGTPGCTKQACAFRDSIKKIRDLGAEVYGVSADTVGEQAAFHKEHHLNFDLLADPEDKIVDLYGTRMGSLKMSKRWTYIIDPELKIKNIMKDVDPVLDSARVSEEIAKLQKSAQK